MFTSACCTTLSRIVGIPNGRFSPFPFGMYTRRSACGRYRFSRRRRCISESCRSLCRSKLAMVCRSMPPAPLRERTFSHAHSRFGSAYTLSYRLYHLRFFKPPTCLFFFSPTSGVLHALSDSLALLRAILRSHTARTQTPFVSLQQSPFTSPLTAESPQLSLEILTLLWTPLTPHTASLCISPSTYSIAYHRFNFGFRAFFLRAGLHEVSRGHTISFPTVPTLITTCTLSTLYHATPQDG